MKQKIAVIGGGVAGLAAAHHLAPKFEVSLFEKDNRLGGNAHTITTKDGISFDIAAAVFGKHGYPNFIRLLRQLKVETCSLSGNGVVWRDLDSGREAALPMSLRGMKASRFAGLNPRFIARFLQSMIALEKGEGMMKRGELKGLSMREALERIPPINEDFRLMHLFVMCLVSSMHFEDVMKVPADFFFGKRAAHYDFFKNPIFGLFHSRQNTRAYVEALAAGLAGRVFLNSRIRAVRRSDSNVIIMMEDGREERFDHLVMAGNADQALALLEKPTPEESRILGAWRYQEGPIVVHADRSSFPREHYNLFTFLYQNRDGKIHTSVNGHIRNLKSVPDDCPYISSQHPNFPIAPDKIEFAKTFRTPIFDHASVATIRELPSLNGQLRTYYCGSHFGYGLHEDCVTSALAIARALGVPNV